MRFSVVVQGDDRAPQLAVEPQLGVVDADDRRVELDLLPRPARRQQPVVEGQLIRMGEVVDDPVVADPEPLVLVVDEHEADPILVDDALTRGRGQVVARPQGIGDRHLDIGLHPHGGEVVHPCGPGPEGLQKATALRRTAFALVGRDDQRVHDRPVPCPHAGEVVDGEGRGHGSGQHRLGRLAVHGFQPPAPASAQVPGPVAAPEPLAIRGGHDERRHGAIGRRATGLVNRVQNALITRSPQRA